MIIDTKLNSTFYHVHDCPNGKVKVLAERCISAQRSLQHAKWVAPDSYDAARHAVSQEALAQQIATGEDKHGIADDESISDVISFNATHLKRSLNNDRIANLRQSLDREFIVMLRHQLNAGWNMRAVRSGHFWYPPGSHMGWHTNNKAPGWRAYLTYVDEPGRSFFRYRDPASGEVITSEDSGWDLRIFRINPDRPIWHAVYSETNRFSFGYAIVVEPYFSALLQYGKRNLRRLIGSR